MKKGSLYRKVESWTPTWVKTIIKRIYWKLVRFYNKIRHIRKGRFVEFGYRFRYDRSAPFETVIDERTILEDFNVWNAQLGNIPLKKCANGKIYMKIRRSIEDFHGYFPILGVSGRCVFEIHLNYPAN